MIETIRQMRRTTSQTLANVLTRSMSTSPSEIEIRDLWHDELCAVDGVAKQGWYTPPPAGIIVAIADPPSYDRVEHPSYRTELTWPSSERHLSTESLLYAYASPVHLQSGIIGDIGCSLYRGHDRELRRHMHNVWTLTKRIAEAAKVGMRFSELYGQAAALIDEFGFENNIYSVHQGQATNIGHTIPWSNESMSVDERRIIETGPPQQRANLISNKRIFISQVEAARISSDIALTIEPRLSGPDLPTIGFHVAVAFTSGNKVVISELDPLFELFDMEWLST